MFTTNYILAPPTPLTTVIRRLGSLFAPIASHHSGASPTSNFNNHTTRCNLRSPCSVKFLQHPHCCIATTSVVPSRWLLDCLPTTIKSLCSTTHPVPPGTNGIRGATTTGGSSFFPPSAGGGGSAVHFSPAGCCSGPHWHVADPFPSASTLSFVSFSRSFILLNGGGETVMLQLEWSTIGEMRNF